MRLGISLGFLALCSCSTTRPPRGVSCIADVPAGGFQCVDQVSGQGFFKRFDEIDRDVLLERNYAVELFGYCKRGRGL